MKVTVEHDGVSAAVEDKEVITWVDSLQLFQQALQGAGFVMDVDVEITWEKKL